MLSIQQQQVNPALFDYQVSLVFVVVVVTTGASTVEGALQAGFGFVILQQLLTYVPARFGGNSLVVVFFAFGALTYAAHPEGILEYQKRRWTLRIQNLIFRPTDETGAGRGRPRRAGRHVGCRHQGKRSPGGRRGQADSELTVADACRCRPAAGGTRRSPRPSAASPPSAGSACRCPGARAWVWSAPTVPARRLCSTASAASCGRNRGAVELEGMDLLDLPTFKRARLGISRTYQRIEVFPDMTVRDHLVVAVRARWCTGRLWKDLSNRSDANSRRGAGAGDRRPRAGGDRGPGRVPGVRPGPGLVPPGRAGPGPGVASRCC